MDRTNQAQAFLAKVAGPDVLEARRLLPTSALESMVPTKGPPTEAARRADGLAAAARSAAEKLLTNRELDPREQFALEAIIIPGERPAVNIGADGAFTVAMPMFAAFSTDARLRAAIQGALPSIGRIEVTGYPGLPFGGTGFVVGPGLLMTNRHVAELFAAGLGSHGLAFKPGMAAGVDFHREQATLESHPLKIACVVMIHPYWDMALLRVEGLEGHAPLIISAEPPESLLDRAVAVVGYPAFDPRNAPDVQNTVFRGIYNVKRLLPGKVGVRRSIASFGNDVLALTHDASTLGGNSGSAMFDPNTASVLGLHFAGLYLDANFTVPTWELARDDRLHAAGVNFASNGTADAAGYAAATAGWWRSVEAAAPTLAPALSSTPAPTPTAVQSPAPHSALPTADQSFTWTIPIEVTIRVGPGALPGPATQRPEAPVERAMEPWHTQDYTDRAGYDPAFLGAAVPLPQPVHPDLCAAKADGSLVLDYHHFSLVMHRARRLALFTAANISRDPAHKRPDPQHRYTRAALSGLGKSDTERWFFDPRIDAAAQLPDKFFTRDGGAFDKGHIVRREDVAWGTTFTEVQAANGDTYHVTNCSPQVAGFNRAAGDENWGDLEKYLAAQGTGEQMSLIAGPVLSDADPVFVGLDTVGQARVQIPRAYWKLVLTGEGGALQAYAFVLEQDLGATPLEFVVDATWQARMVRMTDLQARLPLLRFDLALLAADQSATPRGRATQRMARMPPP